MFHFIRFAFKLFAVGIGYREVNTTNSSWYDTYVRPEQRDATRDVNNLNIENRDSVVRGINLSIWRNRFFHQLLIKHYEMDVTKNYSLATCVSLVVDRVEFIGFDWVGPWYMCCVCTNYNHPKGHLPSTVESRTLNLESGFEEAKPECGQAIFAIVEFFRSWWKSCDRTIGTSWWPVKTIRRHLKVLVLIFLRASWKYRHCHPHSAPHFI